MSNPGPSNTSTSGVVSIGEVRERTSSAKRVVRAVGNKRSGTVSVNKVKKLEWKKVSTAGGRVVKYVAETQDYRHKRNQPKQGDDPVIMAEEFAPSEIRVGVEVANVVSRKRVWHLLTALNTD